jgi:hypothetical protein
MRNAVSRSVSGWFGPVSCDHIRASSAAVKARLLYAAPSHLVCFITGIDIRAPWCVPHPGGSVP